MPRADILLVSLGSTAGLRAADAELHASLARAGARVVQATARPQRDVRTLMLTDLVWARAAGAATRAALRAHRPRAVLYSTTTAALPWLAAGLQALDPAPARLVANAHLAFNLAAAALAFPLLGPAARLLVRLLPDRAPEADEGAPRYLDDAALGTPSVALANASREVLRMADGLEAMLRASAEAFREGADRDAPKALARMDDAVDRLHRAVHDYLGRIPREALGDEEGRRLAEVQGFAIALEHAADVVDRDLVKHAAKRLRRAVPLAPGEARELDRLHAALVEQLRLAVAVFMLEDAGAARRLVRGKEALRAAEREAAVRLTQAADGAAAELLLDAVRDLRRVGAHLATTAHPLLERRGELLPSRLAGEPDLLEADGAP
jgi:phosphate:Na+ symporter